MDTRTKVAIAGVGKGGTEVLKTLSQHDYVEVVLVVDIDPKAEGIELAKTLGIPTVTVFKDLLLISNIDLVINTTGKPYVSKLLRELLPIGVEIVDGTSTRLFWELVEDLNKKNRNLEILNKELKERNKELSILSEISQEVHQSVDLNQTYSIVLDVIKGLKFIDLMAVYLVQGEGDRREAVLQIYQGHPEKYSEEYLKRVIRIPYPKGVTWKVINSGEFNYYEDASNTSTVMGPVEKALGQRALLSIPIKLSSVTIGVIHFVSFEKTSFSQEELDLLFSIGNQVATAIAKARLYEETKNQASKIRESEYKYRTVVENANDGIIIVQDGVFQYLNNKAIEIWGYSADELYKAHFLDLVAPSYKKLVARNYERRLKGENILPYEVIALKKDGGEVTINVSASLIEYEGRPAVIAILRDVTEKKKSEQEVLRLAAAVGSLNTAVKITDKNRTIIYINPAHEKVFGYDPEELIGKHASILLPGDDPSELSRSIYEATLKGGWEGEHLSKRKNGEVFPSYEKTSLVKDRDGKAIAVVSVVDDFSERKKIERQQIQLEKLASLGLVISSVTHEIGNPLTSVLGYSQLLSMRSEMSEEKKKDFLEIIRTEADRIRRVVENLLSFAREHKPEREYVDINEIIENTLALRSYELKVDNIIVIKDLEPDLPRTTADPYQLQQVFLNIIINAEQAMLDAHREGKLNINTRVKDTRRQPAENGQRVIEISFIDSGPGIPKEILEKVFKPFFTTKPIGKGTGLGLSVSYGIVKEHGGEIYALSEEDKGTTLIIELPILKAEVPAVGVEERLSYHQIPKTDGKRILILEDEENIIQMVRGFLGEEGHQVDLASDGEEALEKINAISYDLIISDIKMPGMDGRRFYEEIKRRNINLANKIAFITGDTSRDTRDFINETGNRFLEKPFKVEEFRKLIRDFFFCFENEIY
jgi:PAS domain S-box-containing protein